MEVCASLEGCEKKWKQHLEKLIKSYEQVFQEPKGFPPNREIEDEIQFSLESPLPKIGL
jgi:hypothetical protein